MLGGKPLSLYPRFRLLGGKLDFEAGRDQIIIKRLFKSAVGEKDKEQK